MVDNSNLLPGLGGKPLSPGQIRRNGFKDAVPHFYKMTNGYASISGLGTADTSPALEAEARAIMDADTWPGLVTELISAILASRVFATRAHMEKEARQALALGTFRKFDMTHVEKFAVRAAERLAEVKLRLLPKFDLNGGITGNNAAQHVFGVAAFVAFQALEVEANGVLDPTAPFDEAAFWEDFFRGVADNDPTGYVVKGFAAVYLDHVEEYRAAIAEDMAVERRQQLRAV